MAKYYEKPKVFNAFQAEEEIDIGTKDGIAHASIGDFVVTSPTGEVSVYSPEKFEELYEEIIEENPEDNPGDNTGDNNTGDDNTGNDNTGDDNVDENVDEGIITGTIH